MAVEKPTIRRIKMTVGALEQVDVLRISLVDRGANRAPFRIEKRDGSPEEGKSVVDMGSWFRKHDDDAKQAEVAAVAVGATADVEKAKEIIKAAGYSVDSLVESDDGHRIFVQGEANSFDHEKCQFIKFDDQFGVFVRGGAEIQKRASQDFGENLGAQQFIPGLFMAHDALASTINNILDEADSRDSAVTAIKSAAGKFSAFVGTLADQIPADVFKLERAFDEAEDLTPKPAANPKAEPTKKADADADPKAGADDGKTAAKKGEGDDPASTSDPEGKVVKSDPKEGGDGAVLEAIGGLVEKIDTLSGKVDEVTKVANEAKVLAQKADRTSTALGGSGGAGDPEPTLRFQTQRTIEKSEGGPPLIDTAFNRPKD